MFKSITGLVSLIRSLISLISYLRQYQRDLERKAVEERRQKRDKASEDLKNSESEDAFDKAQDELVRNKPRP